MSIALGQPAPAFSLPGDDGPVSLDQYLGRRLVLYFYPKDDTSGCTSEANAFRDLYPQFVAANGDILGVSRDGVASHVKFRAKHALPFRLVSDAEGTLCEACGVWKQKSMYGRTYMGIERTTLLIDEAGLVRQMWAKVKVGGHAEEVLAALKAL